MTSPLKILVIEDDLVEFSLLERALRQAGLSATSRRVDSPAALEEALDEATWDLVLADYNVPGMDCAETLRRIGMRHDDLPVVIVSSGIGEERAADMLNAGARDFVLKTNLARLPPVMRRCLDEVAERRRHKEAEAALAEREAQYRAVISAAPDGFWMIGGDGRLLAVNEAYLRRSGYGRDELLSMSVTDLEAQESGAEVRSHLETVLREGSGLFETRHRAKGGEIWPVEVNVAYSAEAGGRYFCFLRDLTERKRTEMALQNAREKLEQQMNFHVVRQTIAAIAHELNQPLVAIASYAEAALRLLRAGNLQPEKLQYALESSAEQAQRTGQVVRELLACLTRDEIKMESVDLNAVVCGVLQRIALDRHADFHAQLDLEPDLPPVSANRLQLEKVLANLVENGIEAMHEAAVDQRSITVAVRTRAGGDMAQVTVRDSGPGIDESIMHRIFDPFFTTKQRKGLGMGLPISRSIIEENGGRLWVESEPGAGACFHFVLPFAR